MSNLLKAVYNIIQDPIIDLIAHYRGSNRANNMGDALEVYIKDAFCNSFKISDIEKDTAYSQVFAYLGNTGNPPDMIIRKGDAIEVKKIENIGSGIALNSSYPKDKLHSNDSRITTACKASDGGDRTEKDIIYVIGAAPNSKLISLCFVYGNCYAANKEVYEKISTKISDGISEIPDVELVVTNELAKVKKVDPLGITDLRVRGMRHIENPIKVFSNHMSISEVGFTLNVVMLNEKYLSFPEVDRLALENTETVIMSDIQIKSPNNPAEFLDAKLISYAQ